MKHEFVVQSQHDGLRLDQFLKNILEGLSRNAVQSIIETQGVLLNGAQTQICRTKLKSGDNVVVDIAEKKPFELQPDDRGVDVLYEDKSLLAINKPIGLVVHPGAGNQEGTLVHALIGAGKSLSEVGPSDRPGIVHRLDKETSGILLIAKTDPAHTALAEMFSQRQIHKHYAAIVQGIVQHEEGDIDAPIGRDERSRTKMAVDRLDGREAFTSYKVLERMKYSTYLRCSPVSGRTHQIRVHLKTLGHPVLGDTLYGKKDSASRLALHAHELIFDHPITGKTLHLVAPLPNDFLEILKIERERE